MTLKPWCLITAFLLSTTALADERTPATLDDFAFGVQIIADAKHVVQTVRVPVAVVRGVVWPDLRDLSLFDASGQQVPFALRTPEGSAATTQVRAVPVFALPAAPTSQGAVALRVLRASDGSMTGIETLIAGSEALKPTLEQGEPPVSAYVLETRLSDKERVVGLRLTLGPSTHGFTLPITVDASDDLASFRGVPVTGALARLEGGSERIERDRVELMPTSAKYFRVRWGGQALPAPITGAELELRGDAAPAEHAQLTLPASKARQVKGALVFDLGGAFTIDALSLKLPASHGVVRMTARVAPSSDGPWEEVFAGTAYRLEQEARVLVSPPAIFAVRSARVVALELTPRLAADADAQLELSYRPRQLLFVAQGAGPYTLAYGSHAAVGTELTSEELLSALDEKARASLPAETARVGSTRTLAGPAVKKPKVEPPIRTYVLWAVLVCGAVLVGVLALRTARKV